jgi:hypothetical protein
MTGIKADDSKEDIVDDDVAYYKSEVGHAPVDGMLKSEVHNKFSKLNISASYFRYV